MNKFKKLAENLVKKALWKSTIIITQQAQRKNENGKVIYVNQYSKEVNCVKKQTSKLRENNFFDYDIEFIVAINQLTEFDLYNGHFSISYNSNVYEVKDILFQGTLNNEDCIVSFFAKK